MKTDTGIRGKELDMDSVEVDSSVSEARWLFGFVVFSATLVFASGFVAASFAG